MLRLGLSVIAMSLSRCSRDVLHIGRSHKPGNEVGVKFFFRRAQSFMATVKREKMHEMRKTLTTKQYSKSSMENK